MQVSTPYGDVFTTALAVRISRQLGRRQQHKKLLRSFGRAAGRGNGQRGLARLAALGYGQFELGVAENAQAGSGRAAEADGGYVEQVPAREGELVAPDAFGQAEAGGVDERGRNNDQAIGRGCAELVEYRHRQPARAGGRGQAEADLVILNGRFGLIDGLTVEAHDAIEQVFAREGDFLTNNGSFGRKAG
ncbi:hypothetical protein VF13_18390 [Nostoc linckia z16]|nr:hypothetical protein VF13_18390 [Nostoc linckia z16]